MASYAAWNGKLDYNAAIKDIKNSTSVGAGRSVIKQIMNDATKLGVTDNDQEAVMRALVAFGDKFNLRNDSDFKKLVNSWDPVSDSYKAANAFNAASRIESDYNTLQNIISSYNYNANGATTKKTAADIKKENSPSGNSTKTNTTTPTNTTATTTTTKPTPVNDVDYTGGYGYNPGYGGYNQPAILDNSANNNQELYDRIAELEELLKPRSAEENAERYNIDYNEQHILDDYNTKTNEYYQGALDDLAATRHDYKNNTLSQYDRTISDYLNEYQNAAPTATQRGELAANALAEYMYGNAELNDYDYSMLQAENNLRKAWDAELASNPEQARTYYNDLGTYLSSLGVTQNQADVKQYIDYLDAYGQMYAARQKTQEYIAQGTAAKYAGLANAAATTASAKANKSNLEMLYNYYLATNGGNAKRASTQLTNNFQRSQGYNETSGGGY